MNKIIFILLIILSSCSPQKRLNRILTKHPELLTNDTIEMVDTIHIPKYEHDTISIWKNDTINIETEKYKLKLIKGKNDTIRTQLLIKEQDIKYKYKIIKQKIKVKDNKYIFFFIILFIAIVWFIKNRNQKII